MNILLVSLAFAPFSGVGAARMTSLSRFLVEHGERVSVICYDEATFFPDKCFRKIPDGVVRYTLRYAENSKQRRRDFSDFIKTVIKNDDNIDVVVISVGPFEPLFCVTQLADANIPFVIDYRDPWLLFFESISKPFSWSMIRKLIYDFLCFPIEKKAARLAEKIVFVTPLSRERFIKRYHTNIQKTEIIYNGYEPVNIRLGGIRKNVFSIGIPGKCASYNSAMATALLRTCSELGKYGIDIEVIHVGDFEPELQEVGFKGYRYLGVKEYSDTVNFMAGVDLIVISNSYKEALGTKVFDCLMLNKPILYLGCVPCELSDFISQFQYGFVCDKTEKITDMLKCIIDTHPSWLTDEDTSKYSREGQNNKYYTMLKKIDRKRKSN